MFDAWFASVQSAELEGDTLIITVSDHLQADWLESRHSQAILEEAARIVGKPVSLRFKVPGAKFLPGRAGANAVGLIHRMNFTNFKILSCNRFAAAAVKRFVFQDGGGLLLITGGPGSGKTHLANALGLEFARNNPKAAVRYVRLEAFFNAMLSSLKDKSISRFKKLFRNLDLFIIDDFNFATRAPLLQEELVHTLDSLEGKGKKVVVVSPEPVSKMQITPGLRSRLMGGLAVHLRQPSDADRKAFLVDRLNAMSISYEPELPDFVAEHCPGAIRELQGVINRLKAYHSLLGGPISVEASKAILLDLMVVKTPGQRVMENVADFMGVPLSQLVSGSRKRRVSLARHIVAHILRTQLSMSLQEIGDLLGNLHHTAVLYGVERVEKDPKLRSLSKRLWKDMS